MRLPQIDVSEIIKIDTFYKQLSEVLKNDISSKYFDVYKSLLASNQMMINSEEFSKILSSTIRFSRKQLGTNEGASKEESSSVTKKDDTKDDEDNDSEDDNSVAVV